MEKHFLHSIEYLLEGSDKQKQAYEAITSLGILTDLAEYTPVLCGTIPIGLDIEDSDLDVILEVQDFESFKNKALKLYQNKIDFCLKERLIRNEPSLLISFIHNEFVFELFAQNCPVHEQNAYLHMIVQQKLLQSSPDLREKIIELKSKGMKTEPAFCYVLGLADDPYDALLSYGRKYKLI